MLIKPGYDILYTQIIMGRAMFKGGGPWAPQNFEIFLNIYIYIYNYFNVFKIWSTEIRVGPPKYLN